MPPVPAVRGSQFGECAREGGGSSLAGSMAATTSCVIRTAGERPFLFTRVVTSSRSVRNILRDTDLTINDLAGGCSSAGAAAGRILRKVKIAHCADDNRKCPRGDSNPHGGAASPRSVMYHHSKLARRRRPARQFAMGASGSWRSLLPGPESWENGGPRVHRQSGRRDGLTECHLGATHRAQPGVRHC